MSVRAENAVVTIFVLSLSLSACAHALHVPNIEQRQHVEVRESQFEREITLIGLNDLAADLDGLSQSEIMRAPKGEFFLRSWIDPDDGTVSHQVYVRIQYHREESDGWRRAGTEEAEELEVARIDYDVSNCSARTGRCTYVETIGIDVRPETLEEFRDTGLRIRLFAQSGRELDLYLSSKQIGAQLETKQDVLARR